MIKVVEIKIFPDKLEDEAFIYNEVVDQIKEDSSRIKSIKQIKRSIDARGRRPFYRIRCEVFIDEDPTEEPGFVYPKLSAIRKKVVIIGAGPAGYFAALKLLSLGIKPIVLDRGKDVQSRRRDLRAIQQFGEVNPHSNYCFGEGGAGTYSDGKLYTRSHKRGSISEVLQIFVDHGAPTDILIDAHPHIGSNKLPTIVSNLRQTIIASGGEVVFDCFVTDFEVAGGKVIAVVDAQGKTYSGDAVILATGHSARDIYTLFDRKKWKIEAKPFALGVRIEHSQSFIDGIQYNQVDREENLPASSYSVVCQVKGAGVFSFCMCPGGLVVPAATAPGEIVVNGMSLSRRDSPFANSGFVTSVENADILGLGYEGELANMYFQKQVEQNMFRAGDGSQKAPAQRVSDFVKGKLSSSLNDSSYIPGLFSAPLHALLPEFIATRLRDGIREIDKKMKGFNTMDANVIGTESRTSAPVRIPRHPELLTHEDLTNLYPCGEGAGYAGGILSAAMDGQRVALQIKEIL